jgi:hypothetical protein
MHTFPEMIERLSVPSTLKQCRAFITRSVEVHGSDFEKAVGLPLSTLQFKQDIVQALVESISFHLAPKPKKYSELRRQMLRLDKAAASAAKAVRRLHLVFEKVDPIYRDAILKQKSMLVSPLKNALTLQSLSDSAHIYSRGFAVAGAGGAPKMIAFEILVKGLATAFRRVVGRPAKVTWNAHQLRYEGKFVRLVETALPIAQQCVAQLGPKIAYPRSERARGDYIFKMTRSRRVKRPLNMGNRT